MDITTGAVEFVGEVVESTIVIGEADAERYWACRPMSQ